MNLCYRLGMTAQQSIASRRKAILDERYSSQLRGDPTARAAKQRRIIEAERQRKARKKSGS